MEFPLIADPAFETLLALFAAPARSRDERLRPISHPWRLGLGSGLDANALCEAAVLIPVTRPERPLVERPAVASHVVLTVRSANLKSHAGQISLPGGSVEPADSGPAATALREAEEEIGLPPRRVEVLGQLGPVALPSGFRVTPVVGLIPPGLEFTACPREVADVFQTPLELILNPAAYSRGSYLHQGIRRGTLELRHGNYRIWGATAAILHRIAVLCAPRPPAGSA